MQPNETYPLSGAVTHDKFNGLRYRLLHSRNNCRCYWNMDDKKVSCRRMDRLRDTEYRGKVSSELRGEFSGEGENDDPVFRSIDL